MEDSGEVLCVFEGSESSSDDDEVKHNVKELSSDEDNSSFCSKDSEQLVSDNELESDSSCGFLSLSDSEDEVVIKKSKRCKFNEKVNIY